MAKKEVKKQEEIRKEEVIVTENDEE